MTHTFFISSQDPDLDISFGQFGNGFWNPVLKFIFNSSRADQLENETNRLSCDPVIELMTGSQLRRAQWWLK